MKALLAEFDNQADLEAALARLTAAGVGGIETYTPMPPDEAPTGSRVPLCMFVAGILGFAGFFALMSYADVHAYPLDIGGRPDFAWPTFVPIAFELGVLCAMVVGFFGFFVACRMPQLYHPVDDCAAFARASRDGWLLSVNAERETLDAARGLLEPLAPRSLEEYPP